MQVARVEARKESSHSSGISGPTNIYFWHAATTPLINVATMPNYNGKEGRKGGWE